MLRLRRIEIDNVACFDSIVIEPSIDLERRLTVIRAENGSGKTTFLRALRWGMYGERGLPGNATRFSLHPVWWQPSNDGIKTKVLIEFETDGSTRHHIAGNATNTVYQLLRSVTTIGKPAARDDEPDFRRIHEQTQLMVKEGDGTWVKHEADVGIVVDQLLPWGLRDFFVMDADEATDFVGGSENKVMQRKDVIVKTTAAVHSLLGIDVFREASKRVLGIARAFGAQATKAIGDATLNALQDELDQLRAEKAELQEKILDQRTQRADLEDRLGQRRNALETELKGVGAAEELRTRFNDYHRQLSRTKDERKNCLGLLAGELEATDLLASLATSKISVAYDMLRPLYEQGHIPLRQLSFVRDLLKSGVCVCGQDLSEDGLHRRHVAERIAESEEHVERADYLGQVHDAAKSLMDHAAATSWDDRSTQLAGYLAASDKGLSDLDLKIRDINRKLADLDEEKVQVIRDEIATLEVQVSKLNRNLPLDEAALPVLIGKIDSLGKQIHQRQRTEREAADKQSAEDMANLVVDVLSRAYGTIQAEQVGELSRRMNRLFVQMAANVSDDDFEEIQRNKATLKMIAEVGLRPIDDKPDEYEIYALNSRGTCHATNRD